MKHPQKIRMRILSAVLALAMVMTMTVFVSAEESKWSEEKMRPEGWMKVTNEGGKTLGYSPDSGVTIIEDDGFAFKDMNRNGELDPYEDWRLSNEERAADLSGKLSVEEMTPLFTHGGWMSFGEEITGTDLNYVLDGGRAGVTRSAINEGSTTMAVAWTNALQALCEATGDWGIPATISTDPNYISRSIDMNSLAATFSIEEAFRQGVRQSKMYRAVGVTMVLGPQVSVCSEPTMTRAFTAWCEDPALSRDLTDAFISGLQSTWAEDGTDLGWGEDSVYAIAKHYVGDGAPEGGRNDHDDAGKFDVFPGYNFEAHLIPFFDAAFNLKGSITGTSGVMPNYGISYSKDGSLGEIVGGAYSEYKLGLLYENDYQGFILTDWQITDDGIRDFGVEDYSEEERFMLLYLYGNHQIGGTANIDAAAEGYELLIDEVGEEEAEEILRNAVYHFVLTQFQCGLYDNPYILEEHAIETVWTVQTDAEAKIDQQKTFIMLKNSGNVIVPNNGEKKTVYVPKVYTGGSGGMGDSEGDSAEGEGEEGGSEGEEAASEGGSGGESGGDSGGSEGDSAGGANGWSDSISISTLEKYFNVVTDTLGDPTGEPDADGNPTYTENDIIRASAEEIAACDFILVKMNAPTQDSAVDDEGVWTPPNLQYGEYTAVNARRESIGADTRVDIINDGYYGTKTETVKINRSYAGNTVGRDSNYYQLEHLQYVNTIKGDTPVVVLMSKGTGSGTMIFSEVEPLADAILFYYGDFYVYTDALLEVLNGDVEPNGLLPFQMPASMEAVEAQKEDVPRDAEVYVDADGNAYDFAFGMNWSGVIDDERVATYSVPALTEVESIDFHYADE